MNNMDDDRIWRGVHISALRTSLNQYQYPKLIANDEHTILVKLPVVPGQTPQSYPSIFNTQDHWDQTHVKLPCSDKNVTKNHKRRWNMMRELFVNIVSSQQLEAAILNYNNRYTSVWNFSTLHSFFDEVLEEQESSFFFETLLPKIVDLALCLPQLITNGIPLLKQGHKHSLSLSQVQISCLLANAFLCTFPHRNWSGKNSEYSNYPDINFNRLFQCEDLSRSKCVHEKLKCIMNYFRRVTSSVPSGIVTYSRQFLPNNMFPEWMKSNNTFSKLFVSSSGTIEDDGFGLFQVDFANKYVGGGVIGLGCVQEEIRFVACPELILSRLFTQVLGENEALVIIGCERFNQYRGYGSTFEWTGDYVDETPSDEFGRKYCTVIAVDALCYQNNPRAQYSPENVLRDLNKAFVGFSWGSRRRKEELCAIATGNWGCGVFAGDPQLKSIIQLLAAAEIGRDLAYFTFGDVQLRDSMADLYDFISENSITIGKICKLLKLYNDKNMYKSVDLFKFLKMEALKQEEHVPNEEQTAKTYKIFSNSKVAMNHKGSFFCRTETKEKVESAENTISEALERLKENQEFSIRRENDANETRLKRDELQSLFNLYGLNEDQSQQVSAEDSKDDSFEFFDQFKHRMKNSIKKNSSSKQFEPEVIDSIEKLETEIFSQFSIREDSEVKSSENTDYELEEIVVEKNETHSNRDSVHDHENDVENTRSGVIWETEDDQVQGFSRDSLHHHENENDQGNTSGEIFWKTGDEQVQENGTQFNADSPHHNEEKNDVENTSVGAIWKTRDEPVQRNQNVKKNTESTCVNRETLSQIGARLAKSTASERRINKETFCQKRKISDYFNPLNKKLNK